jgi:D-lactate dehydrogenase (cytochrome)
MRRAQAFWRALPPLSRRSLRWAGFCAPPVLLAMAYCRAQPVALQSLKPAQPFTPTAASATTAAPSKFPGTVTERMRTAQAELHQLLGFDRISTEKEDVASHSSDAYSYHKQEGSEAAAAVSIVVYPESTEEVSKIVRICARLGLRMIPYGSGTSLEGHTSAPAGGVFIDLSRMQSISALHVADMDVVVQPGLSWNNLNLELKEHGLFYPVDPGPGASLGGMVATNCSGTNAVRYGTMKANVLNLTVVLPDGQSCCASVCTSWSRFLSGDPPLTCSLFLIITCLQVPS